MIMNKAKIPRALASITTMTLVIAVLALSVAVFSGSIRWTAVGILAALISVWTEQRRLTSTSSTQTEETNDRILSLLTYWQADVQAITNDTPRPDPTPLLDDFLPSPREAREDQPTGQESGRDV